MKTFFSILALIYFTETALAHQPHDPINAVAISPDYQTDKTIFVGTGMLTSALGYLFLKSTNDGETWSVVPDFPDDEILQISLSSNFPKDGEIFVATKNGNLLNYSNANPSWKNMGSFKETNFTSLKFSPFFETDRKMMAIKDNGELVESIDIGKSWKLVTLGKVTATAVGFSPTYNRDNTIVVATKERGILLVTPLEIKTIPYPSKIKSEIVSTIDYRLFDSKKEIIFLGTKSGSVFKSEGTKHIWQKCGGFSRENSKQSASPSSSIQISPNYLNDHKIILGSFEGVWRSDNAGQNWKYKKILPLEIVRFLDISKEFSKNKTAFGSSYGSGILRTTDGGLTWTTSKATKPKEITSSFPEDKNNNVPYNFPHPVAISPSFSKDQTVFAGTLLGTQISNDAGLTWKHSFFTDFPVFTREISLSPNYETDKTIVIGTNNDLSGNPLWFPGKENKLGVSGVFISKDSGKNWKPTGLNNFNIFTVALSPQFPKDPTIFVTGYPQGLFSSHDLGQTWKNHKVQNVNCCLHRLAISPDYPNDKTLFVSSILMDKPNQGLYFSTDNAKTWTKSKGLDGLSLLSLAISPDFNSDGIILVGTLQKGILQSNDRGQNFHPTNFKEPYVTAIAISPDYKKDRTIISATYAGIFVSNDKGQTWLKASVSK
jgi:photosystem II stability/assembly factor-like uncharacterized protein